MKHAMLNKYLWVHVNANIINYFEKYENVVPRRQIVHNKELHIIYIVVLHFREENIPTP